jgi:DNA invertase Pin-like site-specific DNA recombinase
MSAVKKRPVLDELLTAMKEGDVLVVYKLDRLARSMSDFIRIVDELSNKGADFKSLTETIDTASPGGRMMVQILAVFAEYEREMIRERCLAGQRAARARGKKWGRKSRMPHQDMVDATRLWRSGWWDQRTLADAFGVTVNILRDGIQKIEGRGRWAAKQHRAATEEEGSRA